MSGPATAFTFEKWCREKHFLDPILLAYDRTYDDRPDNNFRNGGMCFFGKIKLLYKIYLVNIVLLNLLTCLLLLLIGKWRPIFMLDDKIYSRVFYYLDVKQLYENIYSCTKGTNTGHLDMGCRATGLCNRSSKLLFVNASNN